MADNGPEHESANERAPADAKKEWHEPTLRRLPIAATSSGGKVITMGNDGDGEGKGETSEDFS